MGLRTRTLRVEVWPLDHQNHYGPTISFPHLKNFFKGLRLKLVVSCLLPTWKRKKQPGVITKMPSQTEKSQVNFTYFYSYGPIKYLSVIAIVICHFQDLKGDTTILVMPIWIVPILIMSIWIMPIWIMPILIMSIWVIHILVFLIRQQDQSHQF